MAVPRLATVHRSRRTGTRTGRVTERTRVTIAGAACLLAGLQVVPMEFVVASRWPRPYDFAVDYISDLGNTQCDRFHTLGAHHYVCSPWHDAMNVSFVVSGVALALGAVLLWTVWPRRRLNTLGWLALLVGAACVCLIGLVPENVDDDVHLGAGFVMFPLVNLGIILLGVGTWSTSRWVGVLSVCCGCIGAIATVVYVDGNHLGLGRGTVERLSIDPYALWLLVVGVWLVWRTLRSRHHAGFPEGCGVQR